MRGNARASVGSDGVGSGFTTCSVCLTTIEFGEAHRLLPQPWLHGLLYTYSTTLVRGSYLDGAYSVTGWWYFFPVVLAVKTPIGLLLLAAVGLAVVFRGWRSGPGKGPWQQILTVTFPIVILLVCMPSRIDLGVRHILPIYPLLAIAGGHAVTSLFRHSRSGAAAAALLAAWVIGDSARAHPDYLAHFNEFAGSHPEAILCESDLDWGQDLDRLRQSLNRRGIQEFSVAYFGTGDETHVAFHFPLMPRMFMAIHMEDRFPILDILAQTPAIPANDPPHDFRKIVDQPTAIVPHLVGLSRGALSPMLASVHY